MKDPVINIAGVMNRQIIFNLAVKDLDKSKDFISAHLWNLMWAAPRA
jgi:hypothetical protein